VGIELPKYSIQTNEQESSLFKTLLFPFSLLLSLVLGYFGSDLYANQTINTLQIRNNVLEEENAVNQDLIAQQETNISLLKTENKVQQQATLLLQSDYKDLIEAQDEYKSEITFYQRLLSPSAENKGLRVFETRLNQKQNLSYKLKVILAQKIERANNISGSFSVNLIGKEKSLPKTLQINSTKETKFNFKYFYTLSLDFSLPEGFQPEQLVVELFPTNKKAKTVKHTVDWETLIKLG